MQSFFRSAVFTLAALLGVATSAHGQSITPSGQPVRNIKCEQMERVGFHIHQHLTILDHGKPLGIPADVGRPLVAQCYYWLHTHTPDGIIHVESPIMREYTLGDFFAVWGEPLSRRVVATARPRRGEHIAFYLNGNPYTGDPQAIPLAQHSDIAILVGPPYKMPAPFTDWQGN
jgi:hypothetical protein